MNLDELARKIAGVGIPGLVLLIAVSATGYTGAAAVTTALAAFGGPLGMAGGVGTLVLIGLISDGIAKFGVGAILGAVLDRLVEEGYSQEDMVQKIDSYPITEGLKLKLKKRIDGYFDEN